MISVVVTGTYMYEKMTKNCTHHTDVSFPDGISNNNYLKCKHWGNLDEGYMESLFTIFTTSCGPIIKK